MNFNSLLGIFRWIAVLEGVSYLILVLIGMPLKYIFKNMEFILFAGWTHGVLFVAFCILLLLTGVQYKWKFSKMVIAFIASLLPLGTFWFEYKLRKETNLSH